MATASTQQEGAETGGEHHDDAHHVHPPSFYFRIYLLLLVLLAISFVGPWVGDALNLKIITYFTAFGIAVVKAYYVMKYFMHLDVEKPFVHYFLATSVVFMGLMFAGISPDVMNHEGTNWQNLAAKESVEAGMAKGDGHGGGHGGHGGDAHGDEEHHGEGEGGGH